MLLTQSSCFSNSRPALILHESVSDELHIVRYTDYKSGEKRALVLVLTNLSWGSISVLEKKQSYGSQLKTCFVADLLTRPNENKQQISAGFGGYFTGEIPVFVFLTKNRGAQCSCCVVLTVSLSISVFPLTESDPILIFDLNQLFLLCLT